MNYNPDKHYRRSIRLKGYDYRQAGVYYVTICCNKRQCLFGEIAGGVMRLNGAGMTVGEVWDRLPRHFSYIELDAFIVMPNHVHGIIVINEREMNQDIGRVPARGAPSNSSLPHGTRFIRGNHSKF